MPKIVMICDFDAMRFGTQPSYSRILKAFGLSLNKLVAEVVSTDDIHLDPETDIDFIVQYLAPGSIAPSISFEIETIGYPTRKQKLTADVMEQLKRDFVKTINEHDIFPQPLSADRPLIWLKYVDPDGHHV